VQERQTTDAALAAMAEQTTHDSVNTKLLLASALQNRKSLKIS